MGISGSPGTGTNAGIAAGAGVAVGAGLTGEDEPELEDPEEFERIYRSRVEIVVDGGPMWPEPSTILQADGNEFRVSRVGKGPVPET